jgi:hypothetical protein
MMALSDITEYSVSVGTTNVESLAFRKCRRLLSVELPEGLLVIGDAAFSLCDSLRHIEIPASVERIGVAAFCKSGIESILFRGVPKVIEADTFEGCWQLKEIVVPTGSRDVFVRKFGLPADKTVEGSGHVQITRQTEGRSPVQYNINLFEQRPIALSRFSYNARYFYWTIGDEVNLKDVFSGPISLVGAVTYEFRRKALFIFVNSATAKTLNTGGVYNLPKGSVSLAHRYQDKYANRTPRIFIFVSNDGKTARVFDEVKLVRIHAGGITVKSLLK